MRIRRNWCGDEQNDGHVGKSNPSGGERLRNLSPIPPKEASMTRFLLVIVLVFGATQLPAWADGSDDLMAGLAAQRGGDADKAIRLYSRALHTHDLTAHNRAVTYANRGSLYVDKKDYPHAIGDLDAALRLEPSLTGAHFDRGRVYLEVGQYEKAAADCDAAIEAKPDFAAAYELRGFARMQLGQYDKAVADYNAALALDPNLATTHNYRGLTYLFEQKNDKALADYNDAIRLRPDYAEAYNGRGDIYLVTGEYEKAVADFDKVLQLHPDDALAYRNRGGVRYLQARYDEAISDFVASIRLDPDNPEAYDGLGYSYLAQGHYAEGAQALERSIVLAPKGHYEVQVSGPSVPYDVLWLHLARRLAGQADDAQEFAHNAAEVDLKEWPRPLVDFYLGKLTKDQLLEVSASATSRRSDNPPACSTYFFLGEEAMLHRDPTARDLLSKALEICPTITAEHRMAADSLERLNQ
jgi:tetratricopeptide (TPR) repeat protein